MDDPSVPKISANNPQTVIRVSDDIPVKDDKKKQPVPPILIDKPHVASSSRTLVKTRVASRKEVKDIFKEVQATHRTARGTPGQTRKRIIVDDDVPTGKVQGADDQIRPKASILPSTLTNLINKPVDNQKIYTEGEVWDLLQSCDSLLYDFGKKHKLDLEDLAIFAACVKKHTVDPQVITEHVNPGQNQNQQKPNGLNGLLQGARSLLLGDPHQQSLDDMHKKYEEMEKKEPENYKALLLELFKTIADEEDGGGQTNRSKIADTHIALQGQTITDQKSQIQAQYVALGVTTFLAVAQIIIPILLSNGIIPAHNNTH